MDDSGSLCCLVAVMIDTSGLAWTDETQQIAPGSGAMAALWVISFPTITPLQIH